MGSDLEVVRCVVSCVGWDLSSVGIHSGVYDVAWAVDHPLEGVVLHGSYRRDTPYLGSFGYCHPWARMEGDACLLDGDLVHLDTDNLLAVVQTLDFEVDTMVVGLDQGETVSYRFSSYEVSLISVDHLPNGCCFLSYFSS